MYMDFDKSQAKINAGNDFASSTQNNSILKRFLQHARKWQVIQTRFLEDLISS
jgi:hypothetical protein